MDARGLHQLSYVSWDQMSGKVNPELMKTIYNIGKLTKVFVRKSIASEDA
jgi:hypothetical protein